MNKVKPTLLTLGTIAIIGWVGYKFYDAYQTPPFRLQGKSSLSNIAFHQKYQVGLMKY